MAPAGTSSPATLDPPVLPQASFARADNLLIQAAQLRAEAEAMKAAMKSSYDKALQFERSAVELQENAEEDREYVQAELDATLEYHSDVLEDFVLIAHNELELKRLTTSVEEGNAYVHEVIGLGEQLLHFKAAKLESSKSTGDNPSSGISRIQNDLASSSQLASHSQAFQQAPSPPTKGTAFWRHRINSLFGKRFSDVQHSLCSSPVSGRNDETTVETRNKNIGSLHQEQTIDGQGYDGNEVTKASSSPNNTSTDSTSAAFPQNAVLPPPDDSATVKAAVENQIEYKKGEIFTAKSTAAYTPGMIQSHTEDFIPLGSPGSDTPIPNDLKKRESEAITTQHAPKRGLTKAEKATTINEHKTLARYRELIVSDLGPNDGKVSEAKKKIKQEMRAKIKNDDSIPLERKKKLISYGLSKTSELIDRENRLNQPELPRTDATTLKELKRRSESTTTQPAPQPAAKRRKRAKTSTEEEKASFFNEPEKLARFRELFAGVKGNNKVKKTRAKKAMKLEMKRKILQDKTSPHSKKRELFLYGKQQINLLARMEGELRHQLYLESHQTAKRYQPAEMSDLVASDRRAEKENEREGSAEQTAIYPAEMSDVSVDDAQWP